MKTLKYRIEHEITEDHITAGIVELLVSKEKRISKLKVEWSVRDGLKASGEEWREFHGAYEDYPNELYQKAKTIGASLFPEIYK